MVKTKIVGLKVIEGENEQSISRLGSRRARSKILCSTSDRLLVEHGILKSTAVRSATAIIVKWLYLIFRKKYWTGDQQAGYTSRQESERDFTSAHH